MQPIPSDAERVTVTPPRHAGIVLMRPSTLANAAKLRNDEKIVSCEWYGELGVLRIYVEGGFLPVVAELTEPPVVDTL